MVIKVGDKLPSVTFKTMSAEGPKNVTTEDAFKGKTVALFAVPGAFTPTCSARHLPSFKENAEAFKAKGVDAIACTSVNDVFVMAAWAKDQGVPDMLMLADGNGEFAKAVDLVMDGSGFGLGTRSQRYSMLVKDGVVTQLNIEEPGKYEVSSGEYMLGKL